jgi:hypothetical protein
VSTTRPALACLLACAMLASAIAAPAAIARPIDQEQYLASYGTPSASANGTAVAEAQEQYYSSYRAPATQGDASYGVPWVPIVLPAVAVALAAAAVGATRLRRRHGAAQPRARVAV